MYLQTSHRRTASSSTSHCAFNSVNIFKPKHSLYCSVLLEFLADIAPNSQLLPRDPAARARARLFIDAVTTQFVTPYADWLYGKPTAPMLAGLENLQARLPDDSGYALGGDAPSNADFALLPMLIRVEIVAKHGLLPGAEEFYESMRAPKFAKLWRWADKLRARASWAETYDEVSYK